MLALQDDWRVGGAVHPTGCFIQVICLVLRGATVMKIAIETDLRESRAQGPCTGEGDTRVGNQQGARLNRVSTLKEDNSPLEVFSVPLGVNPYAYAKRMAQRNSVSSAVQNYLIESNGRKEKISREALLAWDTE
jgi:hypothetical protein